MITRCKKCNDIVFSWKKHSCEKYIITDEDGETYEVYGTDEEDAVEKYAKHSNENGDYYLMNTTVIVSVDGTRYSIGAEPDVRYAVIQLD